MSKNISVCGIDCAIACEECNKMNEEFFNSPCKGCNAIEGKLFWTKYLGLDTCPIYNCCANEKQFSHCGECAELPCSIYFNTKDPSIPDERFEENIKERVNILKNLL
jgi:hypothetical protein